MPRVSVIIPMLNEERTIEEVVRRVRATQAVHEIIVVDDGSRDRSAAIVESLAATGVPPVELLRHEHNRGKGAAVRTGIERVTGDIVITQDADLELDPAEFPRLLEPILAGRADVVFGVRFARGRCDTPWLGYVGNRGFSLLAGLLFLRRVNDILTGYRVMTADLARRLPLVSRGFGMDAEQSCRALRAGCRIEQVPVTYLARGRGEGKKLRLSAGFAVLRSILRVRFGG